MADPAVRPSSDAVGRADAAAGAPSTSSSPPFSASPSASSSGRGACCGPRSGTAFAAFPPGQAVMYGVWLLPAVLAPLIVRKPGAALFAELIAAVVSALLGSAWGTLVLLYGLLQGVAGEVGFAAFRYRRFGWPQALLSAALRRGHGRGARPLQLLPRLDRRLEAHLPGARRAQHRGGRRRRRAGADPGAGASGALSSFAVRPHPGLTSSRAGRPLGPAAVRLTGWGIPARPSRRRLGRAGRRPRRRARRAGAAHRRLRFGQVHAAARAGRAARTGPGEAERRRRRSAGGAPTCPRRPAGLPGPRLPAGDDPRRRRRRVRAGERRHCRRSAIWPAVDAAARRGRLPVRPGPRHRGALGRAEAAAGARRRAGRAAPGCSCSTSRPPSSIRPARHWSARPSPGPSPTGGDAGRRRPRRRAVAAAGRPRRRAAPGRRRCVEHGPAGGRPPRCGCPSGVPRPADRSCSAPTRAGFTHRGHAVPALPPDRRRPARRAAPSRSPGPTARASPPSRCCSPALRGPTTGRVVGRARAHRGPAPARSGRRTAGAPTSWSRRIGTVFQQPRAPVPHRPGPGRARARAPARRRRASAAARRRRRAARAAAARPPGRGQPLHAVRRAAAAALGGHRAGRPAARRWCSTSRRSGRTATPGRAGRAARRAAGRGPGPRARHPRRRASWTHSPTTC